MEDKKILYYASNQNAPSYISLNIQPQGYKLLEYKIGNNIDSFIFMLFSPVWVNNHFISCDKTWKKYLAIEYPLMKLVTVGTFKATQHNYIDILNPPMDFRLFFDQAKPVSESWTPVDTGGLDMEAKLQRFFEGHGNNSIRQVFSPIYRQLNIVKDELNNGTIYQEILQELIAPAHVTDNWNVFRNRFSNYYPFFYCLPFFTFFQKIHILVNEIDVFFKDECRDQNLFEKLQCTTKISEIKELLSQVEQYV